MTDRKGIFMEPIWWNGDIKTKMVFKRGAYWADTFVLGSTNTAINVYVNEHKKNKVAPNIFTKWSN